MDKMEIGTEIVWQGRTYALDGDVGAQTLRFAAKTFCGTVYGDRTAAAARALVAGRWVYDAQMGTRRVHQIWLECCRCR